MSDPDFSTRSIGQLWDAYCQQVLLQSDMPAADPSAFRTAFYAGSYGVLRLLVEEMPQMSEAAAALVLNGLLEESRAHLNQLLNQPQSGTLQ